MQVEPIKPMFKAPVTQRLKLKYDEAVSNFTFISTCAATPRWGWRSYTAARAPPARPSAPSGGEEHNACHSQSGPDKGR